MSEYRDGSGTTPFNEMKQRLFSKLQISTSGDMSNSQGSLDSRQPYYTPRVIIPQGSQSLRARTQTTSDESPTKSQITPPFYIKKSFQGSKRSGKRKSLPMIKSLRSSPAYKNLKITSSSADRVFNYSQELDKFESYEPSSLRSEEKLDDKVVCTCGQQYLTRSLPSERRHKISESDYCIPLRDHRRNMSFVNSSASDRQMFESQARMINTKGQIPLTSESTGKVRRTGLKERDSNSTVPLTCSWSINTGKIKIVKSCYSETSNPEDEQLTDQMILPGNDTRHRRNSRSSCYRDSRSRDNSPNKKILFVEDDEIYSKSETAENIAYSSLPTTGASVVVNVHPADDFRQAFESESLKIPSIHGHIKIMFQFLTEYNQFLVSVLRGSNIAGRRKGTLGVYLKVCLVPGGHQMKRSTDKHASHEPIFDEHFSFRLNLQDILDRQLRIKLYNKPGILSIPESLGECTVPLFHYDLTAVTVIWQSLKRGRRQQDASGEFDFSTTERSGTCQRGFRSFLCGI